MKTKLILCDVDGTLLTSEGIVDPRTVKAITDARDKGILFGLSTGRDLHSVLDSLKSWGIDGLVDVVIGSGGGEIADLCLGREEKNFPLNGALIEDIVDHYKDLDVNFVIPEGGVLCAPKDDKHIQFLSKADRVPYEVVDFNEFLQEPRQKVMLTFEPETMEAVKQRSQTFHSPQFKGQPLVTASILFEYMDPRISKTYGIEKICGWHRWDIADVVAFGDEDNDYDMIKNVGTGVVMANGSEKTLSAADYVTLDNNSAGIADFIEKYILTGALES